ncbi:MAG: phosphoribosylformylglycinamidine synthase I [Pirellulaceae bacterium]|nr:phosphoribosylformylglycinamidine synthase I [Pirellulaceae bacterium]
MAAPRVLILRAPGTNCDRETAFAFEQAGGSPDIVHINRLLETPSLAASYQILCLPGGFSYGDDIAAGRIAAGQMRHHLYDSLQDFRQHDKLILGICNGFQILLKAGILLADHGELGPQATLAWNDSSQFEDRWVHLKATGDHCVFLRDIQSIYLPIAHAEGKFIARDTTTLSQLEAAGNLTLRYIKPQQNGRALSEALPFPFNPNGSQANVAGACDDSGRVFGLMPHPERYIDPTHHPRWTRQPTDEINGLKVFQNAVDFFA